MDFLPDAYATPIDHADHLLLEKCGQLVCEGSQIKLPSRQGVQTSRCLAPSNAVLLKIIFLRAFESHLCEYTLAVTTGRIIKTVSCSGIDGFEHIC